MSFTLVVLKKLRILNIIAVLVFFFLLCLSFNGLSVELSLNTVEQSCNSLNLDDCFSLGHFFDEKWDLLNAKSYYQKSCNLHHRSSCYNLALLLIEEGKIVEGRSWLYVGCMHDHFASCVNLGIWEQKYGQEEKAKDYFEQGCEGGSALGCYFLGLVFEMKRDPINAQKAFKKGCDLKDLENCLKTALYMLAQGAKKESLSLFESICSKNIPRGCRYLGFLYEKNGDMDAAKKVFEKACHGLDGASCFLYTRYLEDQTKKIYYNEMACKLNFTSACNKESVQEKTR